MSTSSEPPPSTAPSRPSFEARRRGSGGPKSLLKGLVGYAICGGVIVAAFRFGWLPTGDDRAAQNGRANAQGPPQQAAPFTPDAAQSVELATAASIHRQQLTTAKFKQRQTIAAFDELTRDLAEWEKELTAWRSEVTPLLKSDEGKRVAGSADLTRRFRAVLNQDRPGSEAVAAAKRQAEELISPVRESLANTEDAAPPSDDIVATIRGLQTQARAARERYRQGREAVKAILAESPAPGAKTLEEAVAQADREDALERAAVVEAEAKKARDEGTRLIAQEQAKLITTESEAEAQRLRDEAAKKKQASELAAAKTVEEMELKQKESATEIARLRDLAELKRQGALTSKSVWKGKIYIATVNGDMTMTVSSRDKDQIQVVIKYEGQMLGSRTYTCQGTVKGNAIQLDAWDGMTIEAAYQPASQAVTGRIMQGATAFGSFTTTLQNSE
jgi:hypothetical protein